MGRPQSYKRVRLEICVDMFLEIGLSACMGSGIQNVPV